MKNQKNRGSSYLRSAIALTAFCIACFSQVAGAQERIPEMDVIQTGLSDGDAILLMSVASDRLELALLGASQQYSKSQATLVLKKFFEENRPRSFVVVDSIRAEGGIFLEGRIRLKESNRVLRAYLRVNRTGGAWKLRELLIERADR